MKKLILILLILAIPVLAYTQEKYTRVYGKVTQHEMTMTAYEKDKDAEAVVLYELGENWFTGEDSRGFILRMKVTTKIKILKQSGKKYAEFEIPYTVEDDRYWESVELIEGKVYNYDNSNLTTTELDTKKIFEEKRSDKVRVKKIAMPDVREGSVIEFTYTIASPYYLNMRAWEYQKKIPVVYSELCYRAIPYYEYTYILKGRTKFDEFRQGTASFDIRFGRLLYKELPYYFVMTDLPAFRDQEFITSDKDYMVSLNFQVSRYHNPMGGTKEIMSTWPLICDNYLKQDNFGRYIKSVEKEAKKNILPTLDLVGKTELEQLKTITKYVKMNYNWNQYNSELTGTKLSDFLKQKTGNAANVNLFLAGLLTAAGLDATPVVLSTRSHGVISVGHPFVSFLNYVIVAVTIDGNTHYTDATESLLDFDELPERCINVKGLLVKPKSNEWVDIEQKQYAMTDKQITAKIDVEKGIMLADLNFVTYGYNAYRYRGEYLGKITDLEKYLFKRFNINTKNGIEVKDYEDIDKPFSFSFAIDFPIEKAGDKLFINPFCKLTISENPFKQTERTLPVDLIYLRGEKYKSVIEIPAGYKVEYMPKVLKYDSRQMTVNYLPKQEGNLIEVTASYEFKSNIYPSIDYLKLKAISETIVKTFNEMIVLVKE